MKFLNKNKLATLLLVIFLLPNISLAQSNTCSSVGYTVFYINGINTDINSATTNRDNLRDHIKKYFNNQPVTVDFLYNPTHTLGLDALDATIQKYFDQNYYDVRDSDFVQMMQDASQKVNTQKLLLVGHSQGNFYTNTFYDAVADEVGGVPSESMGVYGIATPANRVAGDGLYITSDTDKVIAGVVARAPKTNILKPNVHIDLNGNEDYGLGHSFSDVYLKYQGDRIISDIKNSLEKLKNNNIQKEYMPCINPPKETISQKVQGLALTGIDFSVHGFNDSISFVGDKYLALINGTGRLLADTGSLLAKGLTNATVLLFDKVDGTNVAQFVKDSEIKEVSVVPVVHKNIQNNNIKLAENISQPTATLFQDTNQGSTTLNTTSPEVIPSVSDSKILNVPLVSLSDVNKNLNTDTVPAIVLGGGGSIAISTPDTPTTDSSSSSDNLDNNSSSNNSSTPVVPPPVTPPDPTPPPPVTPAHTYQYTYPSIYTFGTGNGDGRDWKVWAFNGSNVYDWQDTYVDHYLREEFKLLTYPGGFYCSRCLEHAAFTSDPRLGFDASNMIFVNGIEGGIQGNGNGITYTYVLQWDATGYTITISHDSHEDYNIYIGVPHIGPNTWTGWDVALNNFQTSTAPTNGWQNVPYLSPGGLTGGSDLVLTPYPIYVP